MPDHAFVLCAFARVEKIEPRLFDCWLELLRTLPAAVLWLGPANATAITNLRDLAHKRGVAPARLIFIELAAHALHLARHQAADLYLDTWSFNAHTTALDALHAGIPVVTCKGASWSARICAAMLTAIGQTELITETPAAYAELVVALARDRPRLQALRARLAHTLLTANPFAPARIARHLEAAYSYAWARHCAGQLPVDFEINSTAHECVAAPGTW